MGLLWFLAVIYPSPMIPTYCFLYAGSRPRRGRFVSWLIASVGSILWLPLYLNLKLAMWWTITRPAKITARADAEWIEKVEADLRQL